MNSRTILCWAVFFLSTLGVLRTCNASTAPKKSQLSCAPGKKFAQQGDYSSALLQWRVFAAGPSQKEWGAASIHCLQSSKLATSDKQIFEWFVKAAQAGDGYAQVHLALIYVNGYGTNVDFKRARELLVDASARGDEAAELILMEMDKMTKNSAASEKSCSEK